MTPKGIPSLGLASCSVAGAVPVDRKKPSRKATAIQDIFIAYLQDVAKESQVAQKMVMLIRPFIEKNEA